MWRRSFGKKYKLQTIKQVVKESKRVTEVSASIGIMEQTVYHWLRKYYKYDQEAFQGSGNPRVDNEYKNIPIEKNNNSLSRRTKSQKSAGSFKRKDISKSRTYHS